MPAPASISLGGTVVEAVLELAEVIQWVTFRANTTRNAEFIQSRHIRGHAPAAAFSENPSVKRSFLNHLSP